MVRDWRRSSPIFWRRGASCCSVRAAAAPRTGSRDLEWVPASGLGVVYSTTTIRVKPPQPNYNVALIDLAEGLRMIDLPPVQ